MFLLCLASLDELTINSYRKNVPLQVTQGCRRIRNGVDKESCRVASYETVVSLFENIFFMLTVGVTDLVTWYSRLKNIPQKVAGPNS